MGSHWSIFYIFSVYFQSRLAEFRRICYVEGICLILHFQLALSWGRFSRRQGSFGRAFGKREWRETVPFALPKCAPKNYSGACYTGYRLPIDICMSLTHIVYHGNDPRWPNLSARAYSFSFFCPLNTRHLNIRAFCISCGTGIYSGVVLRSKLNVWFEQFV